MGKWLWLAGKTRLARLPSFWLRRQSACICSLGLPVWSRACRATLSDWSKRILWYYYGRTLRSWPLKEAAVASNPFGGETAKLGILRSITSGTCSSWPVLIRTQVGSIAASLSMPKASLRRVPICVAWKRERCRLPLTRQPYLFETSLPWIFAVGDVRGGSIKRVASAVGEGSIAISFVHQVLRNECCHIHTTDWIPYCPRQAKAMLALNECALIKSILPSPISISLGQQEKSKNPSPRWSCTTTSLVGFALL